MGLKGLNDSKLNVPLNVPFRTPLDIYHSLIIVPYVTSGLSVNPLSPNSDQGQFSPNNIHTLSRDML